MNAAVQYVYKRRTVAPGLYESGILPGESEDSPGVYLPTKSGRLTPRQTPDVFLHIFLSATSCASHSAIHPRLTP